MGHFFLACDAVMAVYSASCTKNTQKNRAIIGPFHESLGQIFGRTKQQLYVGHAAGKMSENNRQNQLESVTSWSKSSEYAYGNKAEVANWLTVWHMTYISLYMAQIPSEVRTLYNTEIRKHVSQALH